MTCYAPPKPPRGWACILAAVAVGALCQPIFAQDTPYQDAVLADNPVAYWRFEETNVAPGMIAADTASGSPRPRP